MISLPGRLFPERRFPSALVLSSPRAALAARGGARPLPSVPAPLHHFLLSPISSQGFQRADLAASAFPAPFCVCLSKSGRLLRFPDAGSSHPFISLLNGARVHASVNLLLVCDPGPAAASVPGSS